MSGTLGAIRRERQRREEVLRKAQAEADKRQSLELNREAVIAEICEAFGWTELDEFARKMIDDAFAGQLVDVKQLKKDLAKWKEEQEHPQESPKEE
jgi:hypothetical protein